MADDPLVSIITPTHNRARVLPRAIASVLAQTHENLELIVVDDCSTDRTPELISSMQDPRLRYVRLPENVGAAAARNAGLEIMRGDFACFLDDDDEILPDKLRLQLEKFAGSSPDVGLVYCGASLCLDAEKRKVIEVQPVLRGAVYAQLLGRNYFVMSSPLIRREDLEAAGGFDAMLSSCIDWDLWIRIARRCEFDYVPDLLCIHYIHGDQISTSLEKKIAARELIMHKYGEDLSRYPASFADSLRRLAILYCLAGDPGRGRTCFRKALSTGSGKNSLYAHLLLAALAPSLHRRMLERRFTLEVGEERFLI